MSIVLQSSSGGSITVNEPTTASNFTQTLPAATGTIMVSGNQPAFSAYQSSAQTLSSVTFTKLQFQTEEFDTANAFDSTTNYRFTPTVAGYYQVNGLFVVGAVQTQGIISIYKNGIDFKRGMAVNTAVGAGFLASALIYLNGSTDYIELYGYVVTGQVLASGAALTYFQASMVRAA